MSMPADLRELRVFLVLADELHFGRAAQRLTLTPSRVSQVIRKLERSLGGRLFERTSRSVRLTPLGEKFLASVRPAYEQLERAMADVREQPDGIADSLRIGFTATTDGPVLNRLTEAFQARHPGCHVSMHEVSVCEPYAALRKGEVDVVANWLAVREADLTVGPAIAYYERVLATSRRHRLAGRAWISFEELGEETIAAPPPAFPDALADALFPRRTPSGRPIRRAQVPRSPYEIMAHVARGEIVQLTMTDLVFLRRDDVALVPVRDLEPMPLGLISPRNRLNAAVSALAEVARSLPPFRATLSQDQPDRAKAIHRHS
jgi:DNA-binding transcriptional LysR family regulator